jgi:hypothetical protein
MRKASIATYIILVFLALMWLGLMLHYYDVTQSYLQTFWRGDIHEKYMVIFSEAFMLLCLVMLTFIALVFSVVVSRG